MCYRYIRLIVLRTTISLEKNNLLNKGNEFYFYYYAMCDTVYSHHKDIAKAGLFRFYKNNINDSGT